MARHKLRVSAALFLLFCRCVHGAATKDGAIVGRVNDPFAETPEGQEPQTVPVYQGEDSASAAQRVAAENDVYEAADVLEIARAYKEQLSAQEDFAVPKELVLRTGGAYMRRAEEAIKEKRFAPAAADCLRALMRPGLDPTATEPMMKRLDHALLRMQRIKEMQQEDARLEEEKYAAQRAEADALAKDWKVILAEDEELWSAVDASNITAAHPVVSEDSPEVATVDLTIRHSADGDDSAGRNVRIQAREGEDHSHAAFQFCAANDIHSAEEVLKVGDLLQQDMQKNEYTAPKHMGMESVAEHLRKGQSHQEDLQLGHAGAHYARGLQAKGLTEEQKAELESLLKHALAGYKSSQLFHIAWQKKDHQGVIDALKDLPNTLRSDLVQLVLARAYFHIGKSKESISAITSLLNQCDKSGDWLITEPRLIAAMSGAILALRVGDIDKAKRIYQIVLRNDPEQLRVKRSYKVLRSFMKILSDIEELLAQSKNHDAVKAVDRSSQILESVLGKEGAVNAGTRLLLFECKSKSAMTFHDDAIEACNTAIEQFENHDNPDPRRIAEAYAWRAEANKRDNSFDDAVADMQVALTKNPNSQEYQEQLQDCKEKQSEWNKSEDQRDRRGESLGTFYVNRPIKQMLDLPDNIDELDKDTRCKWLKSAFRKMLLRWHPDKAKGGKKRAQRKSAEMGEGKGLLELQWGCKGKRR